MSDDLISRSELIEAINKLKTDMKEKRGFTFPMAALQLFEVMVNQQPTAYDVEAVISELEEYIEEYSMVDENGLHNGKWCAMKEAIEVVKGGAK